MINFAMWKEVLVSLLYFFCVCATQTIINVDSSVGNDTLCDPCQSLSRTLEVISSNDSQDVVVVLSNGVYLLQDELLIQEENVMNITIMASSTHEAVIRCNSEGNSGIIISRNVIATLVGIVLENCGPNSTGIFLNGSDTLSLNDCIFRNNFGASVVAFNVETVKLVKCQFINNHNLFEATLQDDIISSTNYHTRKFNSGAGVALFNIAVPTNVFIYNCIFSNNTSSENHIQDVRQLLFKPYGRGSAILIRLINVNSSSINISNCIFTDNVAEVEGAAVYISLSESASFNQIVVRGSEFTKNRVELGAGGALGFNSYQLSLSNSIIVEDCVFAENKADSGGAVSFAIYGSNEESVLQPDQLHFHNCSFERNTALHEGTAIGLFSLVHVDDIGFPVHFSDCSFDNNTSIDLQKESSALVIFRFQTLFTGRNHFLGNIGGGLELISAYLQASGTIIFEENSAIVGGGITMNDRCLLELSPGVNVSFIGNHALESGGAIYAMFPLIRFSVNILNRLCFIQYNDGTGKDVPPQDWKNVSLNFYNNSAGFSGAAVYASTMHQCTWFGGNNITVDYTHNIFNFPEQIVDYSPFIFEGNSLNITPESVLQLYKPDLATAPFIISTITNHELVQSGEQLFIEISTTDQVNNSREAVWSLESPDNSTVLDAVGTNGGTFQYSIPAFSQLNSNDTSTQNIDFSLQFVTLNTLGEKITLSFETKGCHPGYVYDHDSDMCQCDKTDKNIVRCDNDNRYIYLSEGIWGGMQEKNGERVLATARVLPGYVKCVRDGRLPGCLFQFDDIDSQCSTGRKGTLCGSCKEGYGVTMDLQSCSSNNCAMGLALFLFCCVLVVLFSFLVLYFNVDLPNRLKGFFFYAQVIAVVYRAYIVNKDTAGTQAPLSVMVNLLGFGLPLPLCLSRSLEAHQVAVLTYISPLLVIATVVTYTIAARFIRALSERSALRGITFLFLIIYKYLADASFIFVSCTYLNPRLVFLYDGSKSCTGWELGILGFISLCVILFFVVPAPIAVGYICVKHPMRFHQWADVLTKDLKQDQRWWGGWDIGRRLPFVFLGYLLVLTSPSIVLFLMSVTATLILIIHISTLPYTNLYTNIIETVILALLLIINSSLLESSYVNVPEEIVSLLIVLPYIYAIGYIISRIGSALWVKYVPKELINEAKKHYTLKRVQGSNIEASSSNAQTLQMEQHPTTSMHITQSSAVSTNTTTTSSSAGRSIDSSSTQQQHSHTDQGREGGGEAEASNKEESMVYREPLLDM